MESQKVKNKNNKGKYTMVYKKIIAGLGVAAALGIAALPVAGTFAESANVDVTVNVGATIAISADSPATVSMTPNQKTSSNAANVRVSTNNTGGYKLTVKDGDTNTNLVNANANDVIPAVDGVLNAGTAGWNISGGDLSNKAVLTTEQTVKTNSNSNHTAISNDVTAMTYNFATKDAQMQGQYVDTIVYTATAL
jgi:hypothetical protein